MDGKGEEAGVSNKPELTRAMGACLAGPTQLIPRHPPSPGTSRPRSPSRKSSSYLMTLSCRGALHESPMLVSDLASARKFMGWPGTRGGAHMRDGQGGERSVSSQLPDPSRGAPTASEVPDTAARIAQDASGLPGGQPLCMLMGGCPLESPASL